MLKVSQIFRISELNQQEIDALLSQARPTLEVVDEHPILPDPNLPVSYMQWEGSSYLMTWERIDG